jgi:hypothetical protein
MLSAAVSNATGRWDPLLVGAILNRKSLMQKRAQIGVFTLLEVEYVSLSLDEGAYLGLVLLLLADRGMFSQKKLESYYNMFMVGVYDWERFVFYIYLLR